MPRPYRPDLPGVPQHIIQRGNNRAGCFYGDPDRRFYLRCLAEAARRRGCAVHAYVLMANHVHLLVTPHEEGAVSLMLQDVGRRYVRVLNTLHGRTGTLWEGRYKSSLIDSDSYLFNCHRYIELNPVRAGIVTDPAEYLWSSHRHYALGRPNPLITERAEYAALGNSDLERQQAFRSLFSVTIDGATLAAIRKAVNSDSGFGSEAFFIAAQERLGRSIRPPVHGRPSKRNDPGAVAEPTPVSRKLF